MANLAPPRRAYRNTDALLRKLASASLWERRLFLRKRAGPEPYPRFRYKYKAIGTGTPEEREKRARELRDILVEGRLWLSSPRDFNDPFDMTARVTFEPKSTAELRERFKRVIDKSGKPWKERRAMLDRIMSEDRAALLARAKATFSNHFDTAGIFSRNSGIASTRFHRENTALGMLRDFMGRGENSTLSAMSSTKTYRMFRELPSFLPTLFKPLKHAGNPRLPGSRKGSLRRDPLIFSNS